MVMPISVQYGGQRIMPAMMLTQIQALPLHSVMMSRRWCPARVRSGGHWSRTQASGRASAIEGPKAAIGVLPFVCGLARPHGCDRKRKRTVCGAGSSCRCAPLGRCVVGTSLRRCSMLVVGQLLLLHLLLE
ncbi:hypothetical protein CEXT_452871 [Caerostris extrusa]|uniref:Uncharacterized protein n=1 Tax=Caerostris extrusa TaxID=172846 RepID=A0AAV4V027_CAEEX|nr:hypothetical protein CEXT_452871 [Caerostris extrusa]